jgi:hypothetical protein
MRGFLFWGFGAGAGLGATAIVSLKVGAEGASFTGRASASAAALVGRCGVGVVAGSLGCGLTAAPAAGAGGAFCSAEFCASAGDFTCCGSVGCCAARDVFVVTGRLGSGVTNVRAATDSSAIGRSSNENTVTALTVAPMIAATPTKRAVRMTPGAGAT